MPGIKWMCCVLGTVRSGITACRMCSLWELNNFDYYMGLYVVWNEESCDSVGANVTTNINNIIEPTNHPWLSTA